MIKALIIAGLFPFCKAKLGASTGFAPVRLVNAAMVHGALTQLVTGLLLVGLAEMGDGQVNHLKVGIKLAVLVVIAVLVFTNRRKEALPDGQFWAILGLTLANTAVAVLV